MAIRAWKAGRVAPGGYSGVCREVQLNSPEMRYFHIVTFGQKRDPKGLRSEYELIGLFRPHWSTSKSLLRYKYKSCFSIPSCTIGNWT